MSLHAETVEIRKRRVEELVSVKRATRTKSPLVEEPLRTEEVVVEHVLSASSLARLHRCGRTVIPPSSRLSERSPL